MKATEIFCVACWIVVTLFWIVSAFSVKRTIERQPLARRMFYLWLIVVVVILNSAIAHVRLNQVILPRTLAIGLFGDVLTFLGLLIAIWARTFLGRNWSGSVTFKEGHELIQTGPYRFVRHPIYAGLLLMVLGTAIINGRVTAVFAFFITIGALWIKLSEEEKLLERHFSQSYPQYKARTKAMIPFIL